MRNGIEGERIDCGDIPLSVTCELVSTCNLEAVLCAIQLQKKIQNSVIGAQRMMPWKTVKKIIDECAETEVPSMLFSWRGESTLYRQRDENGNIIRFSDFLQFRKKVIF